MRPCSLALVVLKLEQFPKDEVGSVGPDLKDQSDLDWHCLLRPICPNTSNFMAFSRKKIQHTASRRNPDQTSQLVSWHVAYSNEPGWVHPSIC